ncbi:MAG: hypothetical protein PCFJNLEI_00783 [Verrucomicrobiae bacterium]|nr:hypothetical protein [Verrucomicrobiae bacterium]
MKLVKTLTAIALVGLSTSLAFAEGDGAGKPKGNKGDGPRGPRVLQEHLLPLRVVDNLSLSDAQKTKLAELTAAFKKDAEAWDKANPNFHAEMRKARESGDKDAGKKLMEQRKPVMEARKGYVEQFRASLTDEQKAKLDEGLQKARERMGEKGPRGDKGEKKAPKAPPVE